MKAYIDFDGVICDTVDTLLDSYNAFGKYEATDLESYISEYNWKLLLKYSPIIANAIENIKNSIYDTSILTRVHSLDEGFQKVNMLREKGLTNDIIIVPPHMPKSSVIVPNGAILVDDQILNLNDWYNHGGISIFFNKEEKLVDGRGDSNECFKTISNLDFLADPKMILERKIK